MVYVNLIVRVIVKILNQDTYGQGSYTMANSERTFQTELLALMRQQGWHAFKITTSFASGVPDLYVKAPLYCAMWIELKFMKYPGKISLTPVQRKFMRDEQRAGGRAGWAVCVDGHALYANNNPEVISLGPKDLIQERGHGEVWNINTLLEAIIG